MNAFSKLHPFALLIYFAAVLSAAMFINNPVIQLLSLAGAVLFCLTGGGRKRDFLFYLPLMLLVMLTNPLFSHNGITPLFYLGGNAVTLEAVAYGAVLAVMIAAVMLWFRAFGAVMTSEKTMFLFGKIIPKLSLVVTVAMRYVPLLKRRANAVSRSVKASGLYSSESVADRLKSAGAQTSALVGWSLENAVETSKAMKARGYGLKGRRNYSDFRFRKSDFAFLLICIALWAAVMAGSAAGALDFEFYPGISPLPSGAFSVVCYAAYAVMALLPFIIEAEEMIRWKYYRSGI